MRQQLMLLVLIGLVMVMAVLGYRAFFGESPAHELMVVSARSASVQHAGQGAGAGLSPGDIVGVSDVVRTDSDGAAALQYGNGAQLMLGEATTMRVLDADGSGVRIEVDEGTLTARVRAGAPPLDVLSNGRSVRASDADFTMMVSRTGGFSTMARRGLIDVRGVNGTARLAAGQVLHTDSNGAGFVGPVSDSLLLDVEWPEDEVTRLPTVAVAGVTDPFATVTVGEGEGAVKVRAGEDGRFEAQVGLAEGVNSVPITVRDVAGREATMIQTVRRDSTAPVMQSAEVVWGR